MKRNNNISLYVSRIFSALLISIFFFFTSCEGEFDKQSQEIIFEEIPVQLLASVTYSPNAISTSGLAVRFESTDESVASVSGSNLVFHKPGTATILAFQDGNGEYYEAPYQSQTLTIKDLDPNKKTQTIDFELPESWRQSESGQIIKLKATSSSGLPVTYSIIGPDAGYIKGNILYIYHGGENRKVFPDRYETDIVVVASQPGNDEYNPADNVERPLHIIADVLH